MDISLIIPIYKVEAYIADCIRSVIAQKDVNLDIVLVDDCSPDNSAKIASELLDKAGLPYQFVRHERNMGLSAARNSGIKVAKGEYLYFLDSDDELADERALSSLYKEAKSSEADCVVGNHLYVHADYQYVSEKFSERRTYSEEESLVAFCKTKIPVTAWNKLIRKEFLISNDLYFAEGVLHEDQLWSFEIALAHASVLLTGQLTYLYKNRSSSIMQAQTKVKDTCTIYELQVSSYLKCAERVRLSYKAINGYLNSFAWLCYKQLVSVNGSLALYKSVRETQRRYASVSDGFQLRDFHTLLPSVFGYIVLKLLVKIVAKKTA